MINRQVISRNVFFNLSTLKITFFNLSACPKRNHWLWIIFNGWLPFFCKAAMWLKFRSRFRKLSCHNLNSISGHLQKSSLAFLIFSGKSTTAIFETVCETIIGVCSWLIRRCSKEQESFQKGSKYWVSLG